MEIFTIDDQAVVLQERVRTLVDIDPSSSNSDVIIVTPSAQMDQQNRVDFHDEWQDVPTAPLIPSYCDVSDRERIMLQRLDLATRRGLALADEELEKLTKASMNVYANNYNVERAIEETNHLNHQRKEEIADTCIQNNITSSKPQNQLDDRENNGLNPPKHGYEVTDYTLSEYPFDSEYVFSEYKSIYDEWNGKESNAKAWHLLRDAKDLKETNEFAFYFT
jgi:hypothetical protein